MVGIDCFDHRPPQDAIPFRRQDRSTNQADVLPLLRVLHDNYMGVYAFTQLLPLGT